MVTPRALPTGDIVFPGRDEREHCHFYFRQHWIRLLRPFFHMLLWTLFVLAAGYVLSGALPVDQSTWRFILLFLAACWIASQLYFITHFFRYFLYVIVVTDKRIHRIKKTLLTFDDHESIDIWMLQNIHKKQHGIIQNLLGFGTLECDAQDTSLRVHFVPHIGKKYAEIMKLREHARVRMTLNPQLHRDQAS